MKVQNNEYSFRSSVDDLKEEGKGITEMIIAYEGEVDYEKNVTNKPRLNGKEIVGNMEEEDPTMEPIELTELNDIFHSVFD